MGPPTARAPDVDTGEQSPRAPAVHTGQPSAREAFDVAAFYAALNAERHRRDNISWRELAREAQISTVGIGRELALGRHPGAGVLIKLLLWMGDTDLAPYLAKDYLVRRKAQAVA